MMQYLKSYTLLMLLLISGYSQGQNSTKYVISSHKPDAISIVDTNGSIVWQHLDIKHPQDLDIDSEGNILCSEIYGAKMVAPDHSLLWQYTTPEGTQNPVAQILGRNRVLVGNEGPGVLLEINKNGKTRKSIPLNPPSKKKHGQFRFCQKTDQGTYLVPLTSDNMVREYTSKGKIVQNYGIFKVPVSAIRCRNGNTLVGSFQRIDEFDKKGNLIWTYLPFEEGAVQKTLESQGHVTGMVEMPNSNITFALYHTDPSIPDIIEISKTKKVVRTMVLKEINKVAGLRIIDN